MNGNNKGIQKILTRVNYTVGDYYQLYKRLEGFLQKVVPKPGSDCCNNHVLLEFIHDCLTEEKESSVLDHLLHCPRCATAVMIKKRLNTICDQACKVNKEAFFALLYGEPIINPRRLLQ
jgi:hypothetical protein